MKKTLLFIFLLQSFLLLSQTTLVKDINASSDSKEELGGDYLIINGVAYFTADDGTSGTELWRSDGTESGTSLVKDINPGSESSQPVAFQEVNGELLFYADDGTSGLELWKSDGTEGGTVLLKDIAPGAAGSYIDGGILYFNESALAILNNKLYFAADDGVGGSELWVSDGTEAGTNQVFELETGTLRDSPPQFFVTYNGNLFFRANKRLWISDGTTAGTREFTTKVVDPTEMVLANNGFYFIGSGSGGYELWFSDGTEDGTYMVKDICSCPSTVSGASLTSIDQNYAVVGDKFFFVGFENLENELWVTDGTEAGTIKLTTTPAGSSGTSFSSFFAYRDQLIFSSNGGSRFDSEPWISDGTVAGTKQLKDIEQGTSGSINFPLQGINFNNKFYFQVDFGFDQAIWETDGTEEGTLLVTEHLDSDDFNPGDFMVLNDTTLLFFGKHGSLGRELLKFMEPKVLSATIEVQRPISCPDSTDAILEAIVNGGFPPYGYHWEDGSATSTLSNIGAGEYQVTITDTRMSEFEASFELQAIPTIAYASPVVTDEVGGMFNGSIALTDISGGTPPYRILWTTGDTTFIINNLTAGGYVFFLTDANGCEIQSSTILVRSTSSVDDVLLNQITITPTVVNEMINISNVPPSERYNVHLISSSGQLMKVENNLFGDTQIEINQPPGVYFIKLNFNGSILTRKILIVD